jgi:ribosomal protein S18 acetylase RimI-like enzyme
LKLRLAEERDLAMVVALTRRAYAHYRPLLGRDATPVTEDYRPRIDAGQVWLAETESAPIGLIVLEDRVERLLIYSVAVEPEHQHNGLGRRLLDFAETTARAQGKSAVSLYTNAKMERNIGIYRRCGFVEMGRREVAGLPGVTVVDMEKPVTASPTKEG